MSRETSEIRNSIGKSIGAGMASVFGSTGRTYCVLQHQTESQKHRLGENQEIIVDYAEIGRGSNCVVRFGEDQRMVSGVHAAIAREGNAWVIHHHSQVNQTLVNGRPVNKQWYLNNGDLIQLASTGPRLGFMIPQNPTVGSIGLSRRLSLFRQQALRPYRTAIAVLSTILVLAVGGLSFFLYRTTSDLSFTQEQFASARQLSEAEAAAQTVLIDSMMREDENYRKKLSGLQRKVRDLEQRPPPVAAEPGTPPPTGAGTIDLSSVHKSVFAVIGVSVSVSMEGRTESMEFPSVGTGFLLDDGRFITARHVIEPWYFISEGNADENQLVLNVLATAGAQIEMAMQVVSPDGTHFELTSTQFRVDRSGDESKSITDESGDSFMVKVAGFRDGKDWAVARLNRQGVVSANPGLSTSMRSGHKLYVLGYPQGVGIDRSGITPQLTTVEVAQDGLNGGMINISGQIDHGNSGGPVFAIVDGKPQAVGIVSSGVGNSMKFLVPVAAAQ